MAASKLHLSFNNGARGTTLRVSQQEPPWRVVRGFSTPGGEVLAHLHNVSGGILGGDRLDLRVDLASGARAQITSTGATRIYKHRLNSDVAEQHSAFTLGADAYLEYVPDQIIPFAGSRFQQYTRFELAERASLICWELLAPGREAAGERFRYDLLRSRIEIIVGGEPVAVEDWLLEPGLRSLQSQLRLGTFGNLASCYICRSGESPAYWRRFESELHTAAGFMGSPDVLWGITSLRAHGLVLRGVATSGRLLFDGLLEFWKIAKLNLCGRVAALPRKIH